MEIINSIFRLLVDHYNAMSIFMLAIVVIKLLTSVLFYLLNKRQDKKFERRMMSIRKERAEHNKEYAKKLVAMGISKEEAERHAAEMLKLVEDSSSIKQQP